MRKIEAVAAALSNGQWLTSSMLARVQNRFGASILLLRKGDFDGRFWNIEKLRGEYEWQYRLAGFTDSYNPDSPQCLDCGSLNVRIRDDRSAP